IYGPATLAGIGDAARELLERLIGRQRGCDEIEQPRGDDASAAPYLGDVRHIELESLVSRKTILGPLFQNVEAFSVGLHHSIFDAVVNHLHEMARTRGASVNITEFRLPMRTGKVGVAGSLDRSEAGGERDEDGIEQFDLRGRPPDHHAISTLQAPDSSRNANIQIVEPLFRQCLRTADIVLPETVPAI